MNTGPVVLRSKVQEPAQPAPAITANLSAATTIAFPRVTAFMPAILDSLAAHDMSVRPQGAAWRAYCPFGEALLRPGRERLTIELNAPNRPALNRVRYALTSLIDFVAKSEQLTIEWQGDTAGSTLPPDLRILAVKTIVSITANMRRVVFEGEDLTRFDVEDQIHTRLLFQPEGAVKPAWPMLDDRGRIVWPDGGQKLETRLYTIRHVDASAGSMSIDFFDHGSNGPGMRWLRRAHPGDVVGALGPAAHGLRPAKRIVLIGDETGLPGIARILERAPGHLQGHALIKLTDPKDRQSLKKPDPIDIRWFCEEQTATSNNRTLADAARALPWPDETDGLFVWVGCEFQDFCAIRRFLREDLELPASQVVAFSHWRRGMSEDDVIAAGGDISIR